VKKNRPKCGKVKNFQRHYLESEKFFNKFSYFFESENFQNLKMIESKKYSTKLLKVKNISLNFRIQTFLERENFQKPKSD